jgi:hypothetical protein
MKFKGYNHELDNIFESCGFDESEFLEFNAVVLTTVVSSTTMPSTWIEELDKLIGESDIYRRWAAMCIIFLSCAAVIRKNGVINDETIH